jgi:hypothetical protein
VKLSYCPHCHLALDFVAVVVLVVATSVDVVVEVVLAFYLACHTEGHRRSLVEYMFEYWAHPTTRNVPAFELLTVADDDMSILCCDEVVRAGRANIDDTSNMHRVILRFQRLNKVFEGDLRFESCHRRSTALDTRH